jgi:hypothetical protein
MNETALRWVSERPEELQAARTYAEFMIEELAANSFKGDRAAWKDYSPEKALQEIHHHVAKLHIVAVEMARRQRGEEPRMLPWESEKGVPALVLEFGADVGNCCMQLLDVLGILDIDE